MWGYKHYISSLIIGLFEIDPTAREFFLTLTPLLSFADVGHASSAQGSMVKKHMN